MRFNFLALPAELRLQILKFSIPRGNLVVHNDDFKKPRFSLKPLTVSTAKPGLISKPESHGSFGPPVWLLSKEISEDSLAILYGDNTFEIDIARRSQTVLQDTFAEHNLRRIRSVSVIVRLYEHRTILCDLRPQLWNGIFKARGGLRSFSLKANEPHDCLELQMTAWDQRSSFSEDYVYDHWAKDIVTYLKHFGKLLDERDDVLTDISVGSETLRTALRYLPERCHVKVVNDDCYCGRY